jgi:hypothetical protein
MRVSSVTGQLQQLHLLLAAVFPGYCADNHDSAAAGSPLASPFESSRCSLRRSLKLRRCNVCSRLLRVHGP